MNMPHDPGPTAGDVLIDLRGHSWRTVLVAAVVVLLTGVVLALWEPLAPVALAAFVLLVSGSARSVFGLLVFVVFLLVGIVAVGIDGWQGDDDTGSTPRTTSGLPFDTFEGCFAYQREIHVWWPDEACARFPSEIGR